MNIMEKAVITASFAKDSGHGNSVFSKIAVAKNVDHMSALYGPKKEFPQFDEIFDPLDNQASRDVLLCDSVDNEGNITQKKV